ncbi:hypothetical protein GCM10025857_08190 [Alicyclobacillus contaminans]|nr:hypothetical protein GCM10025857_08190 [Alicyclobacillus contaminans]
MTTTGNLDALLRETRVFPPSDEFRAQANVNDERIYERAAQDPEAYWAEQAQQLTWFRPFEQILEWNPPMPNGFSAAR